jgi:hypothetical protein
MWGMWGKYVVRAEGRARARSIFVDLLLLCGVPVVVAADALVGVSTAIGVAFLAYKAVDHSIMTPSTFAVRPHVLHREGEVACSAVCCSNPSLGVVDLLRAPGSLRAGVFHTCGLHRLEDVVGRCPSCPLCLAQLSLFVVARGLQAQGPQ